MEPFLATTLASNLIVAVALVYPLWRIHARAGLPPALALLVLLPGLGLLLVLLVLALARWPSVEGDG